MTTNESGDGVTMIAVTEDELRTLLIERNTMREQITRLQTDLTNYQTAEREWRRKYHEVRPRLSYPEDDPV